MLGRFFTLLFVGTCVGCSSPAPIKSIVTPVVAIMPVIVPPEPLPQPAAAPVPAPIPVAVPTYVENSSVSPVESRQPPMIAAPVTKSIARNNPKKSTVSPDVVLAQLSGAAMILEAPASANVQDVIHVRLIIDPSKSTAQLVTMSNTAVVAKTIRISKIVEAKLVATGFDIVSMSSTRQAISQTELTTWQWDLSGASPGSHLIYLTINAVVTVDDTKVERTINTLDTSILIEITNSQQLTALIQQYWQWIWSTLLLPIIVWLWKRYKRI